MQGELLFHIFGALAQFERAVIQERVQVGLQRPVVVAAAADVRSRSMPRNLARWSPHSMAAPPRRRSVARSVSGAAP
ncbi:MAG: recombinase family protein [Acetobacteraceae bacterium]